VKSTQWLRLAVLVLLFALEGRVAGAGRQVLHGHVPTAAAKLRPIERLAPGRQLNLVLALPLRNRTELTNLLQQLYDPSSPSYHRYLTPQEFAERFGPAQEDYERVIAFAKAQGFTVVGTHPNRTLLDVSGPVGDVEKAFHVNLRSYRHPKENRTFFAPDTEPSVDLATPLLTIGGLDDFYVPKPMSLRASALDAMPLTALAATGSGPNGTFLGRDFRAAYAPGVTLDGSGQTVGLLEFDGYFPSDITAYKSLAGLPNVPLTNVLVNGFRGGAGGQNVEVALDIDMTMAMAPGLSQVIVYEGSGTTPNAVLNRMATDNLSRQLSSSWAYGAQVDAAREQIFLQFAAQGQTMFQASGDLGAWSGAVAPPSDDAFLTVVGGTSLTTSGPGGAWVSETVWPGSGGGISTSYAIPSWQQGVANTNNQGSATMRNIPDVACLADTTIWLVANNGQHMKIGGTSAATPLWAGFAALANQQAAITGRPSLGFLNPALYAIGEGGSYHSAFHDITSGNNQNANSPTKFSAVPGYDLCTGWGTPAGSNLIAALLAPPDALQIIPGNGTIFSGPTNGPFSPAAASYTLTNFGAAPLNWSLANNSSWLNVTSTNGTLNPGGPATTLTLSANPSATNLATGSYAGILWFTNQNNGFGQVRPVTLAVVTPPVIVSQPASQAVMEGSAVSLSVGTSSNALLFYQWRQDNGMYLTNLSDGPNISGSRSATLTIGEMAETNVGVYSVIVSNAAGMVTSSNASLTILPWRPIITSQPASQTTLPGETVRFDVGAIGSEPFTFRWQKNGTNLADTGNFSGSGTSELVIANVAAINAGTYSVLVSNAYGWTSTTGAVLTLLSVAATNVSFATVYSFTGGSDGAQPNGIARGTNGSFYGTAQNGGANDYGTIFQMMPGGTVTPLYSFTGGGDGGNPQAPLTLATDGNLYGTTFDGGTSGYGTVFRAGPNGQPTTLVSLDKPGGALPYAGVVQGSDGNFYGAGYQGGSYGLPGTIFQMTPSGTLTPTYSFSGGNDGAFPYAGVVQGLDGAFYGTTFKGGASGNGVVFRLTTNGNQTILASLAWTNGAYPYAGLTLGDDGGFYGVASSGGAYTNGTVFRVTAAGMLTNLYSFSGGSDGGTPVGTLLLGNDGNFYGTTAYGGNYGDGTLFMLSPGGALTTLAQFDGAGGANPMAPLAQDVEGTFYGTTENGGANGQGAIYRFSVNGAPQITSQPASQAVYSGARVAISVAVSGSQPMFYQWRRSGTNIVDGGSVSGSTSRTLIFSNATPANSGSYSVVIGNGLGLATSAEGILTVLNSAPFFTVQPVSQTVSPGAFVTFNSMALGSLPFTYQWQRNGTNVIDGGSFSGTTTPVLTLTNATEGNQGTYSVLASNAFGTMSSTGAVLTVIPSSAPGTLMTTLYGFTGGAAGRAPNGLLMGTNDVLYGTTESGGVHNSGTTFSLTTNGILTTLASFNLANGESPLAGLAQGSNGIFYGTTQFGGTNLLGNVFQMAADGTLSNLYSFSGGIDGSPPVTELVEGNPGNFYGTTVDGGSFGHGSVFMLTTNGVFTNVISFSGGADGGGPTVKLALGNDGALYGMTGSGGANGFGTIFRVTFDGTLTTFYSFSGGTDGYSPAGGLVQGADGNFYGVTTYNKIKTFVFYGTIFKVSTNGSLTTLYSLNYGDGAYPQAGLVEGIDGNFYGTTYGGAAGNGAVFVISPTGAYTTLVSFDGFNDGMHPQSALVQGPDGSLYGTTPLGGYGGQGTVFRLSMSGAPQITAQPANQSALAGTSASFGVAVFGSAPFSYQWQFNGTNLADGANVSGSTNRLLTLSHIVATNGGNYSVTINNALGSTNSVVAALTVLFAPAFQNVKQTNRSVNLTWSAISGQRYRVQWKGGLGSNTWVNLGLPITATNSTMVTTDAIGTNAQRFYRVQLLTP
jgi:uncharacterized repeat protein (TIGR03803 family)